jgi:cell division protein FtsB
MCLLQCKKLCKLLKLTKKETALQAKLAQLSPKIAQLSAEVAHLETTDIEGELLDIRIFVKFMNYLHRILSFVCCR